MKTISMIVAAAALCTPALVAAQRGGGAGAVAVQRVEIQRVQRIDSGRTMIPTRDFDVGRGTLAGGETGTRIRRHPDDPNRRPPHNPARRRWNAAHPSDPGSSRPDEGR
jgi:hypothetical protein